VFVQIQTDGGVSGLGGPLAPSVAYIVGAELRWPCWRPIDFCTAIHYNDRVRVLDAHVSPLAH
jgi:hypothetical protein